MKNSEIREFLQRFAAGTCSDEEHERFIQWLDHAEEAEVAAAAQAYEAILEQRAGAAPTPAPELVRLVEQGLDAADQAATALPHRHTVIRRMQPLLMAALITGLLLLATGIYYYVFRAPGNNTDGQLAGFLEKNVARQDTAVIRLDDGSRIILNGGSTLRYQVSYTGKKEREVYLRGEAYFDIRHNEQQPFIIHTRDLDIIDLGTIFNVKAYPEEALTEATLLEGALKVVVKNSGEGKIMRKPNEKVTYYNPDSLLGVPATPGPAHTAALEIKPLVPVTEEHIVAETAWMSRLLVFQDQSFAELAASMERRYNVHFIFGDPAVKAYRYTGVFRDESVEQALHELQLSRPFRYTLSADTIYITQ
ncbi:FecR family protein [Chitinophaga japonensis]|uniref:FecR family protein n=1 Tax=Chitinophaga japonensis TaxID=104662 RepID=A0A562SNR3_CHIJA|nr:FecR domain-containing protein [Chitinophaga japonensis]TWI82554.1 FecR family protein [Chitinophaga japonensis]